MSRTLCSVFARTTGVAAPLCLLLPASATATDIVHRAAPAKGGGVDLSITVSVDPPDPPVGYDLCGTASDIVAYTGENVRWCYRITNNTAGNLTRHSLSSGEFGAILNDFPYTLAPGASAFITQVEPVAVSRTETASWSAYNPGPVNLEVGNDSAQLTALPGLELVVTLSVDPLVLPPGYDACGTETVLIVDPGRDVRWCYTIRNLSSIPRTRHTLESGRLGSILNDFPYTLISGGSAFITQVEAVGSATLVESATWTGYQPGPAHVSVAAAQARAVVETTIFADGFE